MEFETIALIIGVLVVLAVCFFVFIHMIKNKNISQKIKSTVNINALIEALGLEKVNILGYSMGSYVALQTAEIKSDNIDHLILLCTKPSGKTSKRKRIRCKNFNT